MNCQVWAHSWFSSVKSDVRSMRKEPRQGVYVFRGEEATMQRKPRQSKAANDIESGSLVRQISYGQVVEEILSDSTGR